MTGKKMWVVHPDDEELEERSFSTLWDAKAWAAALCSSYWIEEVDV